MEADTVRTLTILLTTLLVAGALAPAAAADNHEEAAPARARLVEPRPSIDVGEYHGSGVVEAVILGSGPMPIRGAWDCTGLGADAVRVRLGHESVSGGSSGYFRFTTTELEGERTYRWHSGGHRWLFVEIECLSDGTSILAAEDKMVIYREVTVDADASDDAAAERIAVSGDGDARVTEHFCRPYNCSGGVAATANGESEGTVAASVEGDARGQDACQSIAAPEMEHTHEPQEPILAACAPSVAVSGTGRAEGGVAVSGCGVLTAIERADECS